MPENLLTTVEQKELLKAKAVLDALPDNIFVFTVDGTCIEVYEGQDRESPDFNYQRLKGMNLKQIVDRPLARKLLFHIEQAIALGQTETLVHSVEPSDMHPGFDITSLDKTIWYEAKISPVALNGSDFDSVLWVTRDISRTVEKERQVKQLLERDELTGLVNRRTFLSKLTSYFNQFKLNGLHTSVLIIDLDRFKHWNDALGHVTGDKVLKHVADLCSKQLRSVEIIGRLGGEEFAVILPNVSSDKALVIGERLRKSVEQTPYRDNDQEIKVTISVGVCSFSPSDTSKLDILERSDKAMYKSKHTGRNKVSTYHSK
ncbi:sensor domain-containing diguanylate cyclase [Vibrio sinaloensis]|uniref:sensor domain-containing diguanylate cyclase n=1 Tax=Photobacterium sp. (strain ATCC 43367) TaxID=379097 RepID=UPI0035E4E471